MGYVGRDLVKYKAGVCSSAQGMAGKALYFNCSMRPTCVSVCVCERLHVQVRAILVINLPKEGAVLNGGTRVLRGY